MSSSRKIKDQIKQRDGRCVVCGREEFLDAHHIRTYGATREDDPLNMVTLCRLHHTLWHNGDLNVRLRVEAYLQQIANPKWIVDTDLGFSWQEIPDFPIS